MEGDDKVSRSLVECVPNFSEGRDLGAIDAIENVIRSVPGSTVLDRTSDPDHNRSVITFAGSPDAVLESAVRAAAVSAERIDLTKQTGVHPRIGAMDVLPFVPLNSASLSQCVQLAHEAGQRIWDELHIPVYFYEAAALRPERQRLENVRRGEFETLRSGGTKSSGGAQQDDKRPDIGGPTFHPTAGAVVVGARKILIAFNVNLKTADLSIAKSIARRIRASSGGFPAVKALGLPLASRGLVQVSMNLTDFEQTPPRLVFAEIARMAGEAGVQIAASELIGLIPESALENTSPEELQLRDFNPNRILENRLRSAGLSC
ncbi:MAG: glutamate formimidoyltransferase [Acidobacteriaceae bacterium]|nr:glutamate formimidoyltransferase [Acidobacteriaceae bacterium]